MANSWLDPDKRLWAYDGLGNKVFKEDYNRPYSGIDLEKLLIILMEECGELTQRCSKVLRHGLTEKTLNDLTEEAADVKVLLDILIAEDLLDEEEIQTRVAFKKRRLIDRGYIDKSFSSSE
jgi:NTP pyrophosphatase (non-canonical NTP hydrolase)